MKEKTMETITAEERAAHIIDMFHRITVHHTLWFREAEHQLGFEKALNVMDYAWKQTRKAAVRRLAAQFHFFYYEITVGKYPWLKNNQKVKIFISTLLT